MTSKVQAQLRRLRVFNAAKAFMHLHNRAPDPSELADYLPGLTIGVITHHYRDLDGAAGLAFPTVTGRKPGTVRRDAGHHEPQNADLGAALAVDEFVTALSRGSFQAARVTRKELFGSIDL